MAVRTHRRTNRASADTSRARKGAACEALEARRLLAATLVINGTDAADTIRLRQSGATLSVTKNGSSTNYNTSPNNSYPAGIGSVTVNGKNGADVIQADVTVKVPLVLYGGSGNDSLAGGSGPDRVYAGSGDDTLGGGAGDDVLVSIGGPGDNDTLAGGSGRDNFWTDGGTTDRTTDVTSGDWSHAVGSFFTYRIERREDSFSTVPVPVQLNGQDLADPVAGAGARGWKDFSGNALFPSSGPTEHDVDQNAAADCYFLAPLSSLARLAPERLTSRIVDLGDGTYAVHFERYGRHSFVRVDGDLPVDGAGKPYYGGLGAEGSIWAPIVEKAWAFFRRSEGTYASTNFGRAKELYQAMGISDVGFEDDLSAFKSPAGMLNAIDNALDDGGAVAFWTKMTAPANPVLRTSHVLMVVRVLRDRNGVAMSMVLRDPYKTDGPRTDGANDGYITVTAAQAAAAMKGVTWCRP